MLGASSRSTSRLLHFFSLLKKKQKTMVFMSRWLCFFVILSKLGVEGLAYLSWHLTFDLWADSTVHRIRTGGVETIPQRIKSHYGARGGRGSTLTSLLFGRWNLRKHEKKKTRQTPLFVQMFPPPPEAPASAPVTPFSPSLIKHPTLIPHQFRPDFFFFISVVFTTKL